MATLSSATETLNALKVQALPQVREIIVEDTEIHELIANYLGEHLETDTEYVNERILQGDSGEKLYYSAELADFRRIFEHFGTLSVLVELGYLPFDVVFEMIAFPDRFWNESMTLREAICRNWQEPGVELTDFMRTVAVLRDRYQERREELGYVFVEETE